MILALLFAACGPAVDLHGDAELVARVGAALIARGVRGPSATCPAPRVELSRLDAEVHIALARGDVVTVRRVRDEAAAPAVIESLLAQGLSLDLPAPPHIPPQRPEPEPVAALAVHAELGRAFDGSALRGVGVTWSGGARWRTGLSLFVLQTPEVNAPELAPASRLDVGAAAVLARPLSLGAVELTPAAGLGAAWLYTGRAEARCAGACGRPVVNDGFTTGNVTPRAVASLALAAPVSAELALHAGVVADLSPFARGAARRPGAENEPSLALPAQPLGSWRASAGLRWGWR